MIDDKYRPWVKGSFDDDFELLSTPINEFLEDRKKALTAAVMDNDWGPFWKYCKKYGIQIPKDRKIMMAGCYKAVQGCTDIPEEVKDIAFKKCVALGFSPLFNPEGDPSCLN